MSYFKGFGNGSNSNGQFWYGRPQNFPGFLFKKNVGVGGRKNPLYGLICNKSTYIYNKYKPGSEGIGAQNRANRRAKNSRATFCINRNCGRFYNYLGLYPRYSYKSIDGYFPYPLPITYFVAKGEYKSLVSTKFANLLVFTGNSEFSVYGLKPIKLNYIFVGGGGGGGAGGNLIGAGGGGGGGGQVSYGEYNLFQGNYSINIGEGGQGGESNLKNGNNGGNTYMLKTENNKIIITSNGGAGGIYGENGGEALTLGGKGGVSIGTNGSVGGENENIKGGDGIVGGGGGGSNFTTPIYSEKGGNGAKNITINDPTIQNILQNILKELSIDIPVDLSQILGTGGGAGNACKYISTHFGGPAESSGGKGGKAGGLLIGEGGIGNTLNETGENGFNAISYLGGGGGGGGGGSDNGIGGLGGNGGKGVVILYFTIF